MVHLTTALDPASAVPLYEQLYRDAGFAQWECA